jgi:hypothetical protein
LLCTAEKAVIDAFSHPLTGSTDRWAALLPALRLTRESVVSDGLMFHRSSRSIVVSVYECAADVASRARDWSEFLKAVHQLVTIIYPYLEEVASVGEGSPVSLRRWPEFAGCLVLYFICIPPTPEVGKPFFE